MNNVISQLIDIYQNHEKWHVNRLDLDDSKEYFIRMLSQGNIVIFMDDDKLCGYVEFYKINADQFRRILNNNFYAFDENITDGEICYINAIFIYEEYRKSKTIKFLKHLFFKLNKECKYFVGVDNRHNKRIRIKGA